ncbi:MAG: DM13 domain-containing protein [Candidatus Pacearchaeota archaeon]
MNQKLVWGIVAILFMSLAYYLLSPLIIVKEANDLPPTSVGDGSVGVNGLTLSSANLIASAHEVSGEVKMIGLPDEKRVLRFENLDTVNGPDLYIYLATDTSATDFVDLGEIKATKGNVNYDIPSGTDLEKYDTVLIWCKQFKVLFSYGELR